MKTLDTNPYLESIRLAYRRSAMYEKINAAPQGVGSDARASGQDSLRATKPVGAAPLGIAWDELEREMDRMQP